MKGYKEFVASVLNTENGKQHKTIYKVSLPASKLSNKTDKELAIDALKSLVATMEQEIANGNKE